MKKEEFRSAVRSRLRQTPLGTRQTWSETDLFVWWSQATREDSYLRWDRVTGDPWQHVKGMCADLIGDKAN